MPRWSCGVQCAAVQCWRQPGAGRQRGTWGEYGCKAVKHMDAVPPVQPCLRPHSSTQTAQQGGSAPPTSTHQQDDPEVAAGLLHPARQLGGAGSLKPWPACGQVGRRQQLGHSSLLSTPHTISSAPLAQHHPPPRIIPYPAGKRDNRATCRPSCCGAPAPGRRRPRCPAPRLHSTGSSRCSSRCSSSRCSSSSSRR